MSEATPRTCTATRKDGQPCATRVVGDGSLCFAHDPALTTKRAAVRRRGGENRSTAKRLSKLLPARLAPVFAVLERALSDVIDGSLDPKRATAAAALARAMAAILAAGELEERVRQLEAVPPAEEGRRA